MDIIKDIVNVNKAVAKNTWKSFIKNWYIIFTGIIYVIINVAIFGIINTLFTGTLGILAGFILAIVSSSLISNYLYLLYNIIYYDKITLEDFKEGFLAFFQKIYGIFFLFYIARLLLGFILGPLISLLIFILLNALPETIYQKSYGPLDSIVYTLEFMRDNWLNWLLSNILFIGILSIITGSILTGIFNTHISMNLFGALAVKDIIMYLIGQIVFSIMMIYRGHMYKILSTSTRRKREFMNKF